MFHRRVERFLHLSRLKARNVTMIQTLQKAGAAVLQRHVYEMTLAENGGLDVALEPDGVLGI